MPSDIKIVRKAGRAVGRVQRVGFRRFVQAEARSRGVTGWVKNMSDGSVTMEMQGEPLIIEELIDRIKLGRSRIRVDSLELSDLPAVKGERGFGIKR